MVVTTTSAAARPQPLLHRRVGVGEGVEPLLLEAQHPGVDLVQQVVLGAEVVVEGALGDARRLDDLLDRGAVVALLGEEPGGGGQQPLGYGRAVPVRRPGHCRHLPSVPCRSVLGSPPPVTPRVVRTARPPTAGRPAPVRSSRRRILPLVVFGSSGRISTCARVLVRGEPLLAVRDQFPGSAAAPGRRLTYAFTVSPR